MIETGVLFDDIHSFRDLNLVLAPFVLPPAKLKTNYITVPGRDGSIDATESTGKLTYEDREFSFTFTFFPEDDLTFEERQTVVSNALNGRRCKITIEKDPEYYLEGRTTVNEHFENKKIQQIVVGVRCAPYKMKQNETIFSFDLASNEQREIILPNSKKMVVPTIETSGEAVFEFGAYSKIYIDITVKNPNICLLEGANFLTLKARNGPASIKFTYREGVL